MDLSEILHVVAVVYTTVVIGLLYKRAISREVPEPIGIWQALIPVGLGIIASFLPGRIGLFFISRLVKVELPPLLWSFSWAFLTAGFPEELVKFIAILLFAISFRLKVKNLYEYVLIGAGVGLGFSIAEEMLYGGDIIALVIRAPIAMAHMVFNMIMAEFMGREKYERVNGKKFNIFYYILALAVPMFIHSLFDAGTAYNRFLAMPDKTLYALVLAVSGFVVLISSILYELLSFKKNAVRYSAMSLLEPSDKSLE